MKPWDLVFEHRYEEALNLYDQRLSTLREKDTLDLANRSTVLLCLGRLSEALEGFRQANVLASEALDGKTSPYQESIAVILWLMGDRKEAINTLKGAVEGISDGSIMYADIAGGVGPGLLLWYFGVTEKNKNVLDFALSYLKRKSKESKINYWPGPLVFSILGQKPFEAVLVENFGLADLDQLIDQARTNLLKRRELLQAIFYLATYQRNLGREDDYRSLMIKCTELENPIIELEWYIAQYEMHPGFTNKSLPSDKSRS